MSLAAKFLPETGRATAGRRLVVEGPHLATLPNLGTRAPSVTRFPGAISPARGGTR